MNTMYKPVIGLEVHVELNTKSKMFCSCSADYFGKEPNTHTCPICLGLPGALPYINKEAIEKCLMIGLALNCQVQEPSLFERKNYFYPDLPKGYQISQYRWPLCKKGWVEIGEKEGTRRIRINRVHQEEDTGKLLHLDGGTTVDFNRSGVPLVEIVTEPDFNDSTQVKEFAKKLQQIFRSLGVSNADMERGDMRLEANVSVRAKRKVGLEEKGGGERRDRELPNYRVELKNINSFKFMAEAIEYEIKRQIEALELGEKLTQETRGWNEAKKETYLQRSKEEAHDYRYFPEPDLPSLRIKNQESTVREKMPKLSSQRVEDLSVKYSLALGVATNLVNKSLDEIFEEALDLGETRIEAKTLANYLVNKGLGDLTAQGLVNLLISQKTNTISDESEIEKICKEMIDENPKIVESYKKGRESVIQALIGAVMRKTSGKANADKTITILKRLLKH